MLYLNHFRSAAFVLTSLFCVSLSSGLRQSVRENVEERTAKLVKPEAVRGCYELGALNWKPDLHLDKDEAQFITPPERIELLAERGTEGKEKIGYLVRPAPGFSKSIHSASYWQSTGPTTIEVVFTTGTSGLFMELQTDGNTLRGKAKTHWDFRRKTQTAQIDTHKIDCKNN